VAYAEDVGSEDEEGKADKLGCDMGGSGINTISDCGNFWLDKTIGVSLDHSHDNFTPDKTRAATDSAIAIQAR